MKRIFVALVFGAVILLEGRSESDGVPDDYQLLEYIESTGCQTINTGIEATSNSMISIDFTLTERAATKYLMGTGLSASDPASQLCFRIYLNGHQLWACGAGSSISGNDSSGAWSILYADVPTLGRRERIELDSYGNEVRFNGKRVLRLSHFRNGKGREPISFFPNFTEGSGVKGRIHKAKIFSAGELQANLVPCRRKSDAVLGLYDIVRGLFLQDENGAPQSFIAGPETADRGLEMDPVPAQGWDGETVPEPLPVVRTAICGRLLVKDKDYTVLYSNNSAVGMATILVCGKGDFDGVNVSRQFEIYRLGGAFCLASWNVGHWSCGKQSSTTIRVAQDDFEKTASYRDMLENIHADWMGVCEYSSEFVVGGWANAAESVFQRYPSFRVGPHYSYQWNAVFHSGRFRILESRVDYYPVHAQMTYAYGHRVLVDDSYEVWFVQTHFDWVSPDIRSEQVKWVSNRYANEERVVISGDLNTGGRPVPEMPSRTSIADYELFAAAGYVIANTTGGTYSGCILDNVLVKGFSVKHTTVVPHEGLSDHDAVVVTLEPLAEGRVARPSSMMSPVYDGKVHGPTVAKNPAYSVSCPAKTDAGTHSVVISLVDKASTAWEDGTTDDVVLSFTISKSPNAWVVAPSLIPAKWEQGAAISVSEGSAFFGLSEASYTQAELMAMNPGEYVYTVTVPGNENYDSLVTNIPFTVVESGAFATDANISWQFTGATNRTASVCLPRPVGEFALPPTTVAFGIPYFDSLMPGFQTLADQNLNTIGLGLILIFQ